MKWFAVFAAVAGLAVIGVASAINSNPQAKQVPKTGKEVMEHFTFDGKKRTYLLYLPAKLDTKKPVPLLVMLHYWSGNGGDEMWQTKFNYKADAENFIAVFPDGPNPQGSGFAWNTPSQEEGMNSDAAFVGELIKRLQGKYAIDKKQIYVCGMSQGAFATHAIGCELSSVVAAIAPVNGIMFTKLKSADPVSVLIVNGTEDHGIPFNGAKASDETGGMEIPSVADAVTAWVAHNGCNKEPTKTMRKNLAIEVYSGGREGTEVVLYKRIGGGHEWPGGRDCLKQGNYVGANEIWEFFKRHPKK